MVTPMERDDQIKAILKRFDEICLEIEKIKSLYTEYDALMLQLVRLEFTSLTEGGKTYSLKDNFANSNTAYRVAFVKRYELTVKAAAATKEELLPKGGLG